MWLSGRLPPIPAGLSSPCCLLCLRLAGIHYVGLARSLGLFGFRCPFRLVFFLMLLENVLDMVRHIFGIAEHMAFALIRRCSTLVRGMKMPDLMAVLSRNDFDMM